MHKSYASFINWLAVIPGMMLVQTAAAVDYLRDVKPLLANHCYACHGALKQESDLRLDTVQSMLSGSGTGPALVAGSLEKSELLTRIKSSDPAVRMPPEGKPLAAEEIQLIEQWIADGATHPQDETPQADPLSHWSFRPLRRPELPERVEFAGESSTAHTSTVRDANEDNAIDRFLDKAAWEKGVLPLGPASKTELLRRITIDLIGLPPTRDELHAFLADDSETAYQSVVDRLLQRPEYGERWGRHWMDVWRYSDWYGRRAVPDVMNSYPQIWRWRDWIVRSLIEDKGYDAMVMQMIAGDELLPMEDENIVATGFIVRNWYKWNYETWMKDSVEHTGKAFLGLTLNCAMCHDHKFDPITQEDYFRFRAFFEPLELRHERVAGEADPGPFQKYVYAKSYGPIKSGAIRVFDEKLDAQTFMFRGGDARNRIEGKPPVDARPPAALTPADWKVQQINLPPEASYPGLKPFIRDEELGKLTASLEKARAAESDLHAKLVQAEESFQHLALQSTQPDLATSRPAAGQLIAAERAVDDARVAHRVGNAARQAAEAQLRALRQRIAADDAAYRSMGDAQALAQAAHLAESQAAYLTAEHACTVAEQNLFAAQRTAADEIAKATNSAAQSVPQSAPESQPAQPQSAQPQPAQPQPAQAAPASPATPANSAAVAKALETAMQKLSASRAAVDAARSKLAHVDSDYTPLSPKYPAVSTGRRTALARWMVAPENTLTARVAINHMWLRHFGQPLVESVDNFGIQGKRPTHPELLDWLAVELIEKRWSMKAMHRLIVTSRAYCRSSRTESSEHPNLAKDRDNVSYWRYPARRMEAEVVRDSVLACAGALDGTMGGAELDVADWITRPRRSLYFTQHGESQMLFLSTFDGANVCDCYRRTATVLPTQALAMTNSELMIHYGRVAAEHLLKIASQTTTATEPASPGEPVAEVLDSSASQFATVAFETLLGRAPSAEELQLSVEYLTEQVEAEAQTAEALKLPPGVRGPSADTRQRARENFVIALFNHNDFVTVR